MSENPIWSMPLARSEYRLRCDWPWCWRRATQLVRAWVPTGGWIVTYGRHHCDKHTEKRKQMNSRIHASVPVQSPEVPT